MDVFDNRVAVFPGDVIVAEIPEAPDTEGIELIQHRLDRVLWNAEDRGVGSVITAKLLQFTVRADGHVADRQSDLVLVPVKAGDQFEAQLLKLEDTEGQSGTVRYGRNLLRPVSSPLFSLERAITLAIEMATNVWKNAYAPYSRFKVGAAVVSAATGRVYSGCNVENGSYGATICAERNAILHAIAVEGVIGIEALVVASKGNPLAPPCAQCLQVISEFARPETQVHLVSVDGKSHKVYQFGQLLPHPFVLE